MISLSDTDIEKMRSEDYVHRASLSPDEAQRAALEAEAYIDTLAEQLLFCRNLIRDLTGFPCTGKDLMPDVPGPCVDKPECPTCMAYEAWTRIEYECEKSMQNDWTVYLLRCSDGSLYCGCTNNLDKRLAQHNRGKGAKYTRSRLPVSLFFAESGHDVSSAMKRESEIKRMSKTAKEKFTQPTAGS